eukprot:COSAG01_NODE_4132_length_5322_cov_3.930308_9_plen_102_part_00
MGIRVTCCCFPSEAAAAPWLAGLTLTLPCPLCLPRKLGVSITDAQAGAAIEEWWARRCPSFVWAALTATHLCHACSGQEILRMDTARQGSRQGARIWLLLG